VENSDQNAYFTIFESELRFIAALCAQWGEVETGGDLYGVRTHGNRVVVFLALPPGPNATHQRCHFAQDIDHCRRVTSLMQEHYAMQLVGTQHSHHVLGLDEPSSGDVEQVKSLTGRNTIDRWVEIIATHEQRRRSRGYAWDALAAAASFNGPSRFGDAPDVRINSFVYLDAPAGKKVRCAIKAIPGVSPIRQALIGSGILTDDELGFQGWEFPMEKIVFDAVTQDDHDAATGHTLPGELCDQLLRLPDDLIEKVTIAPKEPFYIVSLPLTDHIRARIAFNSEADRPIQAVHLSDDRRDPVHDVTARLARASGCVSLLQVHDGLRLLLSAAESCPDEDRHASEAKE
jgi:hypothetical protein